jgi:hypothetical protein
VQNAQHMTQRWTGAAVGLVLAALAVGSFVTVLPPKARAVSSPADQFSAERAFAHVERIAKQPHPVGSRANAEVRDYLVDQLTALGLKPTVRNATSGQALPQWTTIARVENIHARIPGSASTGHVVLAAHYDSVMAGPGAGDDGAGVAAILEVARALRAGPGLRNDIDILLTDGEEEGLVGAHAFVSEGVLDPRRSVVLNLEARGVAGPSAMFESNIDNARIIPALARADRPGAWSYSDELYRLLPNNTDLTVFLRAGFAGMNFALVKGGAYYHTPEDSPANLDLASLQHHGANMLAVARHFGEQDLDAPRGGPFTYFPVLGQLVWYPEGLVVPLAVVTAIAFVAAMWAARQWGARLGSVAVAGVSLLAPLGAAAGLGIVAWWVLRLLRPGYGSFGGGDTYRPEWYQAGLITFTAGITLTWYLLLRRRRAPEEIALAVLGWLTALALVMALLLPGASYPFTWPALVGSCALLAATRWSGTNRTQRLVACCAAAVPAVMLYGPEPVLAFWTAGLAGAAFPLILAVMLIVTALPLVDLLASRRAWLLPLAAAVVGLALFAIGLRVDVFDARHPMQTSLVYALDADRGEAFWLSADPVPAPWTARYVGQRRDDLGNRFPRLIEDMPPSPWSGPAPLAQVTPPVVTVAEDRWDGDIRVLRLRVNSPGAARVDASVDTASHAVASVTVEGARVNDSPVFGFAGMPPEGIDVVLHVRGDGPVPLRVEAVYSGLPQVPELAPRPRGLTWSTGPSNCTVVTRTYQL